MRRDEDTCIMCNGLRGHDKLKNHLCDIFEREFFEAQEEEKRLSALFKEVCWYNFETRCKTWVLPWPNSVLESTITIHGCSFAKVGNKRGEKCRWPIWYSGPIHDAPPLPPQIIFNELKNSKNYVKFCNDQCSAPYDYAPGGALYMQLLRSTSVPTKLNTKRMQSSAAAESISRRIANQHDYAN